MKRVTIIIVTVFPYNNIQKINKIQKMEEEEPIFEEEEVVWAKIRGYPWWPAYVCIYLRTDQ